MAALALATQLKVPVERRAAFVEVFEAQGARGAKNYEALLSKVRSHAEVTARIDVLAHELLPSDDEKARDRLVFCGRYSAKVGTPLDDALRAAAAGLAAAAATKAAAPHGKLPFAVTRGKFGDEHARCRGAAFPYVPACSASHGVGVLEARSTQPIPGVDAGQLLGYIAVQHGGYIDDISVFPAFHSQAVASGLIAAAAADELASRGTSVSLDVRAANVPALKLYRRLGFKFGSLEHPGFLDWDGGYQGEASAEVVVRSCPPNADISAFRRA